ncbi:MAG TPA: helix-turn-helix domain-containing protein [Tepidisphaeraceae bacterium]|nr:helix-turn-helix domain-containing protein [Tepidisphaeraceae bacterium]
MTPEKLSKIIGDNLAAARAEAGMTQAALSAKSRVAIHHISRLESGNSELPTVTTLLRLANALAVPVCSLLDPPKKR